MSGLEHLRIPFEKIKSVKKLEGEGYGSVSEGEFDGQRVALKQLNITNLANIKPQLIAEILTISRFRRHPNLVALLGFCDEKNKMILVFEYVGSGNLGDTTINRLTTIQRFEICLGAARGLDYLHTGGGGGVDSGIVHGNMKLSKILLNSAANSSRFEAKVSSFGLSKTVPGKAHSEVAATKESDVYEFGVVLLQVLCGVSELLDPDDDYDQEHHVTKVVPKKLALQNQGKLQKLVHSSIRREIKPEALETYAKIACQCVMEDPHARPTMAQVVEQLQKALRLQGGEVTNVQIPGCINVVEDGSKSEVILESNIEPQEDVMHISTTKQKDSITRDKLDVDGEDKFGSLSKSSNTENNTLQDIITESVPNETHTEDAKNESSNNDLSTERETLSYLNYEKVSNIAVEIENEEDNKSKIPIEETDTDTTEETIIDDNDSNKKSNIVEENKEDEPSVEITTISNGDTTNQEVQDSSGILKLESDRGNFNEVNEDELERLRIPLEKITFGQMIDVRGYGTIFEGEYNHQQVALKRLNITNLGNIKPKLFTAILTVYRFRQHPNLVTLIGFCDENNKEMILIYEHVSGGNLADKMSKHLNTIQRLEICLGAARGIKYLHDGVESVDSKPGIIHGHLKLSKILLNSDSISSKFEAKVSGFGLPKLLPGHVEIPPKVTDPVHAAAGKLTKESDVHAFGVLLLEVLCGVPELVDTDDYQERQVTEIVPKRVEQNMLRKIVHFDIRDEITTESLETYAKIACRCVMKDPPTMSEVVEELEKALRLQGGKVSGVQIFGGSNGNGLSEVPVGEDDHEGESMSMNITEEESMVIKETIDDTASVPEDVEKENDPESRKENVVNLKSNQESMIIVENEVTNKSEIITPLSKSDNDDNSSSAMGEKVFDAQFLASNNSLPVGEEGDSCEMTSLQIKKEESRVTTDDIALEDYGNVPEAILTCSSATDLAPEIYNEIKQENVVDLKSNEESKTIGVPLPEDATKEKGNGLMNPQVEEIIEVQIADGLLNTKTPEFIVTMRGDFSNSATQTQESESKRSNSTHSESSNGDDTTPSDYLLPNANKTSTPYSGNCGCCIYSCWQFIYDRVVSYGGLFWNKLVSCFNWITGGCSSKKD